MISTLVLPFFVLDGNELSFLRQWFVIKERQFVSMYYVIKEVTIDICNIHQIKENTELKYKRRLSIQMIGDSTLVHKINSIHATSLTTLAQGIKSLVFELFSLFWTDNMLFIPSTAVDKSSTDLLFASQCVTWKEELTISHFHLLFVDHFWHLLSVGLNCFNTINAFFGIVFWSTLDY